MKINIIICFCLCMALEIAPTYSQTNNDNAVSFGNKVSVATLVSTLQNSGYQALTTKPAQLPDTTLGVITTGINGAKISMLVSKCPNVKTDDVCSVSLFASYNDDKGIITDAFMSDLNIKLGMSKITRGKTPEGKISYNIMYQYICKDLDDPKFVTTIIPNFGVDITRFLTAYNAVANPQPPAATTQPAAKVQ